MDRIALQSMLAETVGGVSWPPAAAKLTRAMLELARIARRQTRGEGLPPDDPTAREMIEAVCVAFSNAEEELSTDSFFRRWLLGHAEAAHHDQVIELSLPYMED